MKNSRQRSIRCNIVLMSMMCTVYLLFAVGIVKATHFCMGREASVSFFTTESEKCGGGMADFEEAGCCDDERELLKIQDSQKNLSFFEMGLPVLDLLGELYTRSFDLGAVVTCAGVDVSDPPPVEITRYKLYCKYVFYDDEPKA